MYVYYIMYIYTILYIHYVVYIYTHYIIYILYIRYILYYIIYGYFHLCIGKFTMKDGALSQFPVLVGETMIHCWSKVR